MALVTSNSFCASTGSALQFAELAEARVAAAISALEEECLADSLLRQVLLHAYRFSLDEIKTSGLLENEAKRIVTRLGPKLERVSEGKPRIVDLARTYLGVVDSRTAEILHDVYHYLGSPRSSGINLGLYSDTLHEDPRLMTLVTLSQFDLAHVIDALPCGIRGEEILVLSRLFAFSWCPRNALSRTLGLLFSWTRKHRPEVKMLLTYLDPNLGFRGTIYQATNWFLFGQEHKKRYLYLDGDYVTDRQMIKDYGTADSRKLARLLGSRITTSRVPLRPLEIYAYFLAQRDRTRYNFDVIHEFTPPAELVGG